MKNKCLENSLQDVHKRLYELVIKVHWEIQKKNTLSFSGVDIKSNSVSDDNDGKEILKSAVLVMHLISRITLTSWLNAFLYFYLNLSEFDFYMKSPLFMFAKYCSTFLFYMHLKKW